jgi:hypothetical protein
VAGDVGAEQAEGGGWVFAGNERTLPIGRRAPSRIAGRMPGKPVAGNFRLPPGPDLL